MRRCWGKMEDKTHFIRVDEWEPTEEEMIIRYDGKVVIIPFDDIFNRPYQKVLNEFLIKKDAYATKLDHFTKYLNYFVKFYDPENEFIMACLKIKFMMVNKNIPLNTKSFINLIYTVLFTDTIKDKIHRMVEDNYYISPKSKKGGKYLESLEFTEDHVKVLMEISIAMKLMIPCLMHFVVVNGLMKNTQYAEYPLYPFYAPLFDIFGENMDIYNKLYETVKVRVTRSVNGNRRLWTQREIEGVDPITRADLILKKDVISDSMPRYVFKSSIISFNHTIIESQINYYIYEKYQYTHVPLSNIKDSEGLSGLDKLEMNAAKIDESLIILSNANIKDVIKRIRKAAKIDIPDSEFDYYKQHVKINKFQVQLVYYFYAKIFGGYRDLQLLTRSQYITLLVLLKKRLQYQGMVYLPQIITGNMVQMRTRQIQNRKFLSKIGNSDVYQTIVNDKFSTLNELDKPSFITGMLSTILNSSFTVVDYRRKDKLGEPLEINNPDFLSDEFLAYLNQI
jgi:hypothetical protein